MPVCRHAMKVRLYSNAKVVQRDHGLHIDKYISNSNKSITYNFCNWILEYIAAKLLEF